MCGGASEWFATVLGFPLVYLAWVAEQLAGHHGGWPQPLGVVVFVVLWVGNAYLWGHLAAAAIWLASRASK